MSIIAGLSFLAFVVGMINPTIVKCKSRGTVALIFLGVFIVSVIIGASMSEGNSSSAEQSTNETTATPENKDGENSSEIPILGKGSAFTMKYANADVKITFEDIQVRRLPKEGLNLVFSLVIKNNSNETFFISESGWKLLDSDKIEIEESGIYEPMFEGFIPDVFFFTTVDPNVGKREEVGYSVKEDLYYISINGKIIAKIPLNQKK